MGKWARVLTDEPGRTELLRHDKMHPQREQLHIRYPLCQEALKKELDELKVLGILVPSTSPWGSPVVPVAKKDGGVRVCVDFRRVNKITVNTLNATRHLSGVVLYTP